MLEIDFSLLLSSIIAGAAPVLFASLGETITEKAGVLNLSIDGTILLGAMVAFAAAVETDCLLVGFAAAGVVGVLVSGVLSYFSLRLGQSQVAIGFVLTLMCRDLAYFLGNPYCRIPGPQAIPVPIPILKELPFLGVAVFSQTLPVYMSLVLIGFCWWYFYRTQWGLRMRAVGEAPDAAFARGLAPQRLQTVYALAGGFLVGLAGATISLAVKPGWGRPQGAEGTGWIALALVIFGGWHPIRVAAGAFLFSALQVAGIFMQGWFPSVPAQVLNVAPFPLMIFTLLLVNLLQKESFQRWKETQPWAAAILECLTGSPPEGLGKPYRSE